MDHDHARRRMMFGLAASGALAPLALRGCASGRGPRTGPRVEPATPNLSAANDADLDDPPFWVKPPIVAQYAQRRLFQSALVGGPVSYVLCLPPGYEGGDQRYPVVYWLHGRVGAQADQTIGQGGIPAFTAEITRAIADGAAPPMIVVFVNGLRASGFRNAPGRPVESVLMDELIPHIDGAFRTIATREGRMIEGFSMGGAAAVRLALKYPEVFGALSNVAGALHGRGSPAEAPPGLVIRAEDDPWLLETRNAALIRARTPIRIIVGSEDGLLIVNDAFHEALNADGLAHQFRVIDGVGHSPWPLYAALGDENWSFYWEAFGPRALRGGG